MRLSLNLFNPCSNKYHAIDDFCKTLNFGKQLIVVAITFFATLATLGAGTTPCFRLLVNRFKPLNPKTNAQIKNIHTLSTQKISAPNTPVSPVTHPKISAPNTPPSPLENAKETRDPISSQGTIDTSSSHSSVQPNTEVKLTPQQNVTPLKSSSVASPTPLPIPDSTSINQAPTTLTPSLPLNKGSLSYSYDPLEQNLLQSILDHKALQAKNENVILHFEVGPHFNLATIENKLSKLQEPGKKVILIILNPLTRDSNENLEDLAKFKQFEHVFPMASTYFKDHIDHLTSTISFEILNLEKLIRNIQEKIDVQESSIPLTSSNIEQKLNPSLSHQTVQSNLDLKVKSTSPQNSLPFKSLPVPSTLTQQTSQDDLVPIKTPIHNSNSSLTRTSVNFSYDPDCQDLLSPILNNKNLKVSHPTTLYFKTFDARLDHDMDFTEFSDQNLILIFLAQRNYGKTDSLSKEQILELDNQKIESTLKGSEAMYPNKKIVSGLYNTQFDVKTTTHIKSLAYPNELLKMIQEKLKEIDPK